MQVVSTAQDGIITVGDDANVGDAIHLGAISEIAPDAGIFELDFSIRYTDGPASSVCPETLVYTDTDSTTAVTGASADRFEFVDQQMATITVFYKVILSP